jgi:hypothetical protein
MRGDHVVVDRGPYRHHAVDRGEGTVVHFAGPGKPKRAVSIRIDSFEDFVGEGGIARVRKYGQRLDPEESVRRAEALVGTTGYDLLANNCEHLASFCVAGVAESRQVERSTAFGGVVMVTYGTGVVSVEVLTAVGHVAGLSGPGVMTALSTTGRLVNGGAVEGLYLLGLIPAGLAVTAVFMVTRDKKYLTEEERRANVIARRAAICAAVATGILEILLLSAVGKTKGLSGPGISSGLATIGGISNRGVMVGGASVLVTTPAFVAALSGWLGYKASIWCQSRPQMQALVA